MFQTVGHNVIDVYGECMGSIDVIRGYLTGTALQKTLDYDHERGICDDDDDDDEVEDMYRLLVRVLERHPEVEAVACGAVLSDYQRYRVENVCERLGLVPLCFLWRRNQSDLLLEMVQSGMDAIVIKTAAMGLDPHKHCGKSVAQLRPLFERLKREIGFNVCGEGGEYETLTLDCPLFSKRIVIDESEVVMHSDDAFSPVGFLNIVKFHLEEKEAPKQMVESVAARPLSLWINQEKNGDTYDIGTEDLRSYCRVQVSDAIACEGDVAYRQLFAFFDANVDSMELHPNSAGVHMRILMEEINAVVSSQLLLDMKQSILHVVLTVREMCKMDQVDKMYSTYFGHAPPSRTCIANADIHGLVQVECTLVQRIHNPDNDNDISSTFLDDRMQRKILHVQSLSERVPASTGPYSQASSIHNVIRVSGQVALNPPTMHMIEISDLWQQLRQCVRNTQQILNAFKSCIHNTVRCVVYFDQNQLDNGQHNQLHDMWKRVLDELDEEETGDDELITSSIHSALCQRHLIFHTVPVTQLPYSAMIEVHCFALDNNARSVTPVQGHNAVIVNGRILFAAVELSPSTMDDFPSHLETLLGSVNTHSMGILSEYDDQPVEDLVMPFTMCSISTVRILAPVHISYEMRQIALKLVPEAAVTILATAQVDNIASNATITVEIEAYR